MAGVRDRLAVLCDQLGRWATLTGIIRDGGGGAALDELLSTSVSAVSAVGAVVAGPDTDRTAELLDAIDEACAQQGLVSVTGRGSGYRPLPASSSGTEPWVCPKGFCDRVVLPGEAKTDPVCAVGGGTPMKRFRVPA